ncbi:MAG: hypothetical protein ACE5FA_12420, partial [Dehalococcoidia bacterium]
MPTGALVCRRLGNCAGPVIVRLVATFHLDGNRITDRHPTPREPRVDADASALIRRDTSMPGRRECRPG